MRYFLHSKLERLWLLAIVAVGFVVRAATVIVLDIKPESDYAGYQSMALNFIAGRGIVDPMGNHAMSNVGYPLFVLIPTFMVAGDNLLAAQLVNALLGVASIALCYAIAREAGAGATGRLVAAALFALYVPSWLYAEYLAKENLMIPLMLGTIWCALRLARKVSLGVAVICGVLFGLLALTGNAALSLALPVLFSLALAPAEPGRKLSASAIIVVAAFTVAAPWLIRNYHALGVPVLNTNGGFNLYLGNNPMATGYFVSISETPRGPTWEGLRATGEVQASDTLRREAMTWIEEHPREFLALAVKKAILFWTPPYHEGKGPGSRMESLARLLWLVQFAAIVLGALASTLIPGLRTRYVAILWLGILSYTAVHMLFYVIFRYREPIMPLLCILAALTIERLFSLSRRRRQLSNA